MLIEILKHTSDDLRVCFTALAVLARILYILEMRLYSRTTVRQIVALHPQTTAWFAHWVDMVENSSWQTPNDVIKTYPNASGLHGDRIRFEVGHNKFRLIAGFSYQYQACYIKFFGTHKEYDAVNVATVADY